MTNEDDRADAVTPGDGAPAAGEPADEAPGAEDPAETPAAEDSDDGAITAEERGDTSISRMTLTRVLMVLGTVALVIGVVIAGNVLAGGRPPWETRGAEAGPSPTPTPSPSESSDAGQQERSDRGLTAYGDTVDELQRSATALLVAAEDTRLTALAKLAFDDPAVLGTWNTTVLSARDAPYGLADLVAAGAARQDDATTYTLLRPVVVREGARLQIDAPGVTLRMRSQPGLVTSIVGWGGALAFNGSADSPFRITSWDEGAAVSDTDVDDGRAWILVRNGRMESSYASYTDLGFWSGRTGGVAVTTASGGAASAAFSHTEHVRGHYGIYLESVTDTTVTDSTVTDSQQSGIDVTTGSVGVTLDRVTVDGAGHDGIDIERSSSAIAVTDSTVRNSAGFGIRLDGAALGDGPTAPGYTTLRAAGFDLHGITAADNAKGGIAVASGNKITIADATITGAAKSIDIAGPAHTVSITGSTLTSGQAEALVVAGGVSDAVVRDSTLTGHTTAVDVSGATLGFENSTLAVDEGTALRASAGADIDGSGNTLTGVGQDAVLTLDDATVSLGDIDASGFRYAPGVVLWLNHHPIAWMWIAILIIPAVGLPLLIVRARRRRQLRRMLDEAIIRHGHSQIAAYSDGTPIPSLAMVLSTTSGGADASAGTVAVAEHAAPAPPAPELPATPARPAAALAKADTAAETTVPSAGQGTSQDAAARRAAAFRAELARRNRSATPPLVGRPEVAVPRRPAPDSPTRPMAESAPHPAPESPARPTMPARAAGGQGAGPRSLQDLRAMLAGREFASMQQFAVAAVLEAGYSSTTIGRLFRVPAWRIDSWVQEAIAEAERPPRPPRHWTR